MLLVEEAQSRCNALRRTRWLTQAGRVSGLVRILPNQNGRDLKEMLTPSLRYGEGAKIWGGERRCSQVEHADFLKTLRDGWLHRGKEFLWHNKYWKMGDTDTELPGVKASASTACTRQCGQGAQTARQAALASRTNGEWRRLAGATPR